jgi:hypothetical protein
VTTSPALTPSLTLLLGDGVKRSLGRREVASQVVARSWLLGNRVLGSLGSVRRDYTNVD